MGRCSKYRRDHPERGNEEKKGAAKLFERSGHAIANLVFCAQGAAGDGGGGINVGGR
jgi:hypothetical protein